VERYSNYGVFYRSNTHKQIQKLTACFGSRTVLSFKGIGQMDFYYPKKLVWLGRAIDRASICLGLPGIIMAVRVEKQQFPE
jgi:hypothetical protein